jgi:hypothetical protein
MNLDDGGVDDCVFHVRLIRDGVEKSFENVGLNPIAVAFENRLPMAEKTQQVTPRASRPHDPQNCLNEAPVVPAAASRIAWLAQTMRLHLRPLGVRQNESLHPKLES